MAFQMQKQNNTDNMIFGTLLAETRPTATFLRNQLGLTFVMTCIVVMVLTTNGYAMTMRYQPYWRDPSGGNNEVYAHIELAGEIVAGDARKLKQLLKKHPDSKFITIEESPGGSLYEGISIAEVIWNTKFPVWVRGPAASAAALISLGSKTSVLFFDPEWDDTKVLFHCAYIRGHHNCDPQGTQALAAKLSKFTYISANEWYKFLMSRTTPDNLLQIRLEKLFSNWMCSTSRFLTTCDRPPF